MCLVIVALCILYECLGTYCISYSLCMVEFVFFSMKINRNENIRYTADGRCTVVPCFLSCFFTISL